MKQLLISMIFLVVLPGIGLGQTAADTLAVIKQVDSLILVSRGLTDKRDFDKALEVNGVAEKLALEKLGRETAAYGSACANHGRTLYLKSDYPGAELWWSQSKDIRETALGKAHQDYVLILHNLGMVYLRLGNLGKSEFFLLEAKAIREKTLGKEHQDYAGTLFFLAVLYSNMGRFALAEPLHLECKAIREKVLGKEHPDYATSLNSLGAHYATVGNYEKAEILCFESLAIKGKLVGKEDPDYALSLNTLGSIYYKMGSFEKAEPILLKAKEIREKTLGKNHPHYSLNLNSLALLYHKMGKYDKSESYHLEAKTIRAKELGIEHPDYGITLSNLANLYCEIGNYGKAEQLYLEAKDIMEKLPERFQTDYASTLNNLAILYKFTGKYEKAETLFIEAKDIREKSFGKEHPEYAASLGNLAGLYDLVGKYSQVEALLLESKTIWEKALGNKHPNYAMLLENFGDIYGNTGDFQKSEFFYQEATSIRENALGTEHLDYANGLSKLANMYTKFNHYTQAIPLYDQSTKIKQKILTKALHHLSERELHQYLHLHSENQDRILSLAQISVSESITHTVYNNTLFHKGFLLNAYNQVKRLALTDSTTTEKFNLLKSYERRLAAQYAKPVAERKDVVELEEKANNLEKDLVRSVAGYGEAMQQVKWQEVQQNLKPNEAAIEFVHYEFYHKKLTDSVMYAALVLRPGWAQPRMISLFEQRQIQPLLAAANTAATAGQLYATRGNLRGQKTHAGRKSNNKTRGDKEEGIVIPGEKTASLYQLIWAPLDSLLHDVSTVYFAPSGLLHRLDLAAMAVPGTDQILADKYALVQLGSTRQLVVSEQPTTSAQTATLFGGIKYDLEKPAETPDSVTQTKPSYDVAALRSALGGRGSDTWNYLPGTEKEVKNAAKTLGKAGYTVRALSGYDGSEAVFKMMGKPGHPAPRVLHIATHGFFFPDPKDTTQQRGAFSDREPVFKTSDNPLLRSGLVLAGANPAWAGEKTPEGQEDGILTAYEISQVNLSGTELVVLSACETGLGDVEDNEGVYGLKRSFKIAGAKYLIMSLWQVPDQQTQELMSAFYKNWLEDKMAIPKAFAAAQQTMRKRYGDPFFWAGFVLVE